MSKIESSYKIMSRSFSVSLAFVQSCAISPLGSASENGGLRIGSPLFTHYNMYCRSKNYYRDKRNKVNNKIIK